MALSRGDKACSDPALRVVSIPDAFLFFVHPEGYTGEFARSLSDFYEKLAKVPLESVEFHFQRRDFERWIGKMLCDPELADRISRVNRLLRGAELRTTIQGLVKERLIELQGEA